MKFFVPRPLAKTSKESCEVHQRLRDFIDRSLGVKTTDRRIFQLEFVREGEHYDACVGHPEHDQGEIVVAILEAPHKYFICTPNHGGYCGKPISVAKRSATAVVEFDG